MFTNIYYFKILNYLRNKNVLIAINEKRNHTIAWYIIEYGVSINYAW